MQYDYLVTLVSGLGWLQQGTVPCLCPSVTDKTLQYQHWPSLMAPVLQKYTKKTFVV